MNNHFRCMNCDAQLKGLMNYCISCGEKQLWLINEKNFKCNSCDREIHTSFNYCYACGEDINPYGLNQSKSKVDGFTLTSKCECGGKVQEFMANCPWCKEEQKWENKYGKEYCKSCERNISEDWYYCVFCGVAINRGDPGSWARKQGYLRAYQALVDMPKEFRENMRKSLNFNWAKKSKSNKEQQAKELLDCDLKGIVARSNNKAQQLIPFWRNATWREILEHSLDQRNIHYPAHSSEKELEILLLDKFLEDRINIKGFNDIIDDLLGSANKPGLNAVLSICTWLHPTHLVKPG